MVKKTYLLLKERYDLRSQPEIVLLALSLLTIICICPFAIIRYFNHELGLAFINSLIVVVMLCFFIFVYTTRKVNSARLWMSLFVVCASLFEISIKGSSLVYWFFPGSIAIFYLLPYKSASLVNIIWLFGLAIILYQQVLSIEFWIMIITCALLIAFSYIIFRSHHKIQEKLKHLSSIDTLTLAGNRRALNTELALLAKKVKRTPYPLSLVILDLDNFKSINDQYGHIVGDDILKKVSELIDTNVRSDEKVYRYGGEEFVILPLNTDIDNAIITAEKVRKAVNDYLFDVVGNVTISMGVAQYCEGESPEEWVSRADSALYEAKESGRNTVRPCLA